MSATSFSAQVISVGGTLELTDGRISSASELELGGNVTVEGALTIANGGLSVSERITAPQAAFDSAAISSLQANIVGDLVVSGTSMNVNDVRIRASKVVSGVTLTQTPNQTVSMAPESPPPSYTIAGSLAAMEFLGWPLFNLAGDDFVYSGLGEVSVSSDQVAGLVVDLGSGDSLTANTANTEAVNHVFSAWLQVNDVLPAASVELKPGSPANHGSNVSADPVFSGVDLTNEHFFEFTQGSEVEFPTIQVPAGTNIIGQTGSHALVVDFTYATDAWSAYEQTSKFLSTGAMNLVVSSAGELILRHDGTDIVGMLAGGTQQALLQYEASTKSAQLYVDGVLVGTEQGAESQPLQELLVGAAGLEASNVTIDFSSNMSDSVGESLVASLGQSPDLIRLYKDYYSVRVVAPSSSGAGVYWLHAPTTVSKRYSVNIIGDPSAWEARENDVELVGLPIAETLFQMSATDASTALIGQDPIITGTTAYVQGPRPGIYAVQTPPGPVGTNTLVIDTTSTSSHFLMAFWMFLPNIPSTAIDFGKIGDSFFLRRRDNRIQIIQLGGATWQYTYTGDLIWSHFVIHHQPSAGEDSIRLWINGVQQPYTLLNAIINVTALQSSTVNFSAPNIFVSRNIAFAQITYMQYDELATFTPIAPQFNPGTAPQVTSLQAYSPAVVPPTAVLMDAATPLKGSGVTGVRIHSLKFYWDTVLTEPQRAQLNVPIYRFGTKSCLNLLGHRLMSSIGDVRLLQDAPSELFGQGLSHFSVAHAIAGTSIQVVVAVNGVSGVGVVYSGAHANTYVAAQLVLGGPISVAGAKLESGTIDAQALYDEASGLVEHAVFDAGALLTASQRVTAPLAYVSAFTVAAVLTIPFETGALISLQSLQLTLEITDRLIVKHRGIQVGSGVLPSRGFPSPILVNYNTQNSRVRIVYNNELAIDVHIEEELVAEIEQDARIVIGAVGSTPAPAGLVVITAYTFADDAFSIGDSETLVRFATALIGLVDTITVQGKIQATSIVAGSAALNGLTLNDVQINASKVIGSTTLTQTPSAFFDLSEAAPTGYSVFGHAAMESLSWPLLNSAGPAWVASGAFTLESDQTAGLYLDLEPGTTLSVEVPERANIESHTVSMWLRIQDQLAAANLEVALYGNSTTSAVGESPLGGLVFDIIETSEGSLFNRASDTVIALDLTIPEGQLSILDGLGGMYVESGLLYLPGGVSVPVSPGPLHILLQLRQTFVMDVYVNGQLTASSVSYILFTRLVFGSSVLSVAAISKDDITKDVSHNMYTTDGFVLSGMPTGVDAEHGQYLMSNGVANNDATLQLIDPRTGGAFIKDGIIIAFWLFYSQPSGGTNPRLLKLETAPFTGSGTFSESAIYFLIRQDNGLWQIQDRSGRSQFSAPATGAWYHIVAYCMIGQSPRMWIDGVEQLKLSEIPSSTSFIGGSSTTLTVLGNEFGSWTNSRISQVKVIGATDPPTQQLVDDLALDDLPSPNLDLNSLEIYSPAVFSAEQRAQSVGVDLYTYGNASLRLKGQRLLQHVVGMATLEQQVPPALFQQSGLAHLVLQHTLAPDSIGIVTSIDGVQYSSLTHTGAYDATQGPGAALRLGGHSMSVGTARLDFVSRTPTFVYGNDSRATAHSIFSEGSALIGAAQRISLPLSYVSAFTVAAIIIIPEGNGALLTLQSLQVSLVISSSALQVVHRGVVVATGDLPTINTPQALIFNYYNQQIRIVYKDALEIDVQIEQAFEDEVESHAQIVFGAVGSTPSVEGLLVDSVYSFEDDALSIGPSEGLVSFASALLGLVDTLKINGAVEASTLRAAQIELGGLELSGIYTNEAVLSRSNIGGELPTQNPVLSQEVPEGDSIGGLVSRMSTTYPLLNVAPGPFELTGNATQISSGEVALLTLEANALLTHSDIAALVPGGNVANLEVSMFTSLEDVLASANLLVEFTDPETANTNTGNLGGFGVIANSVLQYEYSAGPTTLSIQFDYDGFSNVEIAQITNLKITTTNEAVSDLFNVEVSPPIRLDVVAGNALIVTGSGNTVLGQVPEGTHTLLMTTDINATSYLSSGGNITVDAGLDLIDFHGDPVLGEVNNGQLQYAFDNSLIDTGSLGVDLVLINGTFTYGSDPVNHIVMDGADTYLRASVGSGFEGVTSVVLSTWLFIPSDATTNIIAIGDRTTALGSLAISAQPGIRLNVNTSGSGGNGIEYAYTPDTWFHVVLFQSGDVVRLWYDGVEQSGDLKGTGPVTCTFTSTFDLRIGDDPNYSNLTTGGLGIGRLVLYVPEINIENDISVLMNFNTVPAFNSGESNTFVFGLETDIAPYPVRTITYSSSFPKVLVETLIGGDDGSIQRRMTASFWLYSTPNTGPHSFLRTGLPFTNDPTLNNGAVLALQNNGIRFMNDAVETVVPILQDQWVYITFTIRRNSSTNGNWINVSYKFYQNGVLLQDFVSRNTNAARIPGGQTVVAFGFGGDSEGGTLQGTSIGNLQIFQLYIDDAQALDLYNLVRPTAIKLWPAVRSASVFDTILPQTQLQTLIGYPLARVAGLLEIGVSGKQLIHSLGPVNFFTPIPTGALVHNIWHYSFSNDQVTLAYSDSEFTASLTPPVVQNSTFILAGPGALGSPAVTIGRAQLLLDVASDPQDTGFPQLHTKFMGDVLELDSPDRVYFYASYTSDLVVSPILSVASGSHTIMQIQSLGVEIVSTSTNLQLRRLGVVVASGPPISRDPSPLVVAYSSGIARVFYKDADASPQSLLVGSVQRIITGELIVLQSSRIFNMFIFEDTGLGAQVDAYLSAFVAGMVVATQDRLRVAEMAVDELVASSLSFRDGQATTFQATNATISTLNADLIHGINGLLNVSGAVAQSITVSATLEANVANVTSLYSASADVETLTANSANMSILNVTNATIESAVVAGAGSSVSEPPPAEILFLDSGTDVSGNGHTLTATTQTGSIFPTFLRVINRQYVTPGPPSMAGSTTLSLAGWLDGIPNNSQSVLYIGAFNGTGSSIILRRSGTLQVLIQNVSGGIYVNASQALIATSRWSHYAITYDNGILKLYINSYEYSFDYGSNPLNIVSSLSFVDLDIANLYVNFSHVLTPQEVEFLRLSYLPVISPYDIFFNNPSLVAASLPEFSDEAEAACGGVSINFLYRVGNSVQIRIK